MTATASPKAAGVRVRGSCKNGHVTETIADKGRVTAETTCSTDGCDEKVKCRRIPRGTPAPPAAADDAGLTRIVRIEGYDEASSHGDADAGPLAAAPIEPAAGGQDDAGSAHGQGAAVGSETPPADPIDPDSGQRRGRVGGWLREQRRRSAVRSARREWDHPLGI